MERLEGNRLETVDVSAIKIGDVVDIPVWIDIWYGPGDMNIQPWAFLSFDRVIIVENGYKVSIPADDNISISTVLTPTKA